MFNPHEFHTDSLCSHGDNLEEYNEFLTELDDAEFEFCMGRDDFAGATNEQKLSMLVSGYSRRQTDDYWRGVFYTVSIEPSQIYDAGKMVDYVTFRQCGVVIGGVPADWLVPTSLEYRG